MMGDEKITVHLHRNYTKQDPDFPISLFWGRREMNEREYISVPATGEISLGDARRLAHALLYAADRLEIQKNKQGRGELKP